MAKRVAQMGGTTAQVAAYVGIAKQFVVDTTTWRVHLMDGATKGGIPLAKLSDIKDPDLTPFLSRTDASSTYLSKADASSTYLGKTDASTTYLTKTDAASTYLGKTAKAASATKADSATSATKATQDGSGNVITSTYATQTTANAKIAKSGDRGSLAGYESLTSTASAVTISDGSPDDQAVTGAVAVTVSNGTAGKVWTKTVGITNESATISLGSSWYWVGGKVPTVAANSVLVLKWYGTFGVANLVLTA